MGEVRLEVRQARSDAAGEVEAVEEVAAALDDGDASLVMLFVAPRFDLDRLGPAIANRFRGPVVACTTAGELTPRGYEVGTLTGCSLSSPQLAVRTQVLSPLSTFGPDCAREVASLVRADVEAMQAELPGARAAALLVIDGLAGKEELIVGYLGSGVGGMPVVGGSAGDGFAHERTHVYVDGRFVSDAGVWTTMVTTHPFHAIKTQHFEPSERRLVITAAEPRSRVVMRIDGRPAVEAYADAVGVPIDALDDNVFSRHPLILRLGGRDYVRAIQRVEDEHHLRFFAAIDEGVVLRLGIGQAIIPQTDRALALASEAVGGAKIILGFECGHRRLEIERCGLLEEAGEMTRRHHVLGFHTYGEQFGTIHVNQTFTGLAFGE